MMPFWGDWHCRICQGLFCPLEDSEHDYRGWTIQTLAPGSSQASQPGFYTLLAVKGYTHLEAGMLLLHPEAGEDYAPALLRLRHEIDGEEGQCQRDLGRT